MLLVELTINGTIYRISNEQLKLAHAWDNHILSLDPITYATDFAYGGFMRVHFGGIKLSPDFFPLLPPAGECPITIKYLADGQTDEDQAITLLTGTACLQSFNMQYVSYDIYSTVTNGLDEPLLKEGYAYDPDSLDISPSNDSVYEWFASAGGTNEYYLAAKTTGDDPKITEPAAVISGFGNPYITTDPALTKAEPGSLEDDEWGYGDNDTLGFDTIYIRDATVNPDYTAIYNINKVVFPIVFGYAVHIKPIRINDVEKKPAYWLSDIKTSVKAVSITNIVTHDSGNKTKIITSQSEDQFGTDIIIEGTQTIDGRWTTEKLDKNNYVITKPFESETPIKGILRSEDSFCVYDDGVPIPENFTLNAFGMMIMEQMPVGELTISGRSLTNDASDNKIFEAFCNGVYLPEHGFDIDLSYAGSNDKKVSIYADVNMPWVDFLSRIAAFKRQLFYVDGYDLYLISYDLEQDEIELSEYEYLKGVNYFYNGLTKDIQSRHITRYTDDKVLGSGVIENISSVIVESGKLFGNTLQIENQFRDIEDAKAAIEDILDTVNSLNAEIRMPLRADILPGMKLTWTDTSLIQSYSAAIHVRQIRYDFDANILAVTGDVI